MEQQHRQGLLSTTRDLTVGQWLEIWNMRCCWWRPDRRSTTAAVPSCKLSPIVAVVEAVKETRLADAEVLPVSPSSQLATAPAGG